MSVKVRRIVTDIPDDPPSLDPQRATDMCSTRILNNVLDGLVRVDPDGQVVPGAASDWSVAAGGTEYTFRLGGGRWSDGSRVTAHDFAHAWGRAVRPELESPYATLMAGVTAEAVADDVLRVRLAGASAARFPRLASFSTFLPVKRELPEALGTRFAATERDTAFNGPYRISRWERGRRLVMTRNPGYRAHDDVLVDEIVWLVVKDAGALVDLYRRGELDVVYRVPTRYLSEGFDLAADLHLGADCLTEYLVFNTRSGLLRDAGVRRTLGRLVPRRRLLGDSVRFGFRPAYGLVPPSISGSVRAINGDCFAETLGEPETWPDAAAGPPLAMVGENTSQGIEHMRVIAGAWEARVGVRVTPVPLPLGQRIERVARGAFDVAMVHWRADHDDPLDFLDLFRSGSPWNEAAWNSAAYDRLLDRAGAAGEPERSQTLAAAERLLLDEMPIAPLYYQVRPSLVRPGITGIASAGVGADQGFRWARVAPAAAGLERVST